MADVSLDQVIEAVADAITQLVLFSVEAAENNSMLTNILPGSEVVKMAVDALVSVADDMAARYSDQPRIQSKMYETGNEIRQGTSKIVDCAKTLNARPFDKDAKHELLAAAKNVMQGTVKELHLSDKYDVTKLITTATTAKEQVAITLGTIRADQLVGIARTLSACIVNLVKLVTERIKTLADPVLKRRLDEASAICKSHTQGLIKALSRVIQEPDNLPAKQEHQKIVANLDHALDDIITVAKLSCKSMFDELDLDFMVDPPKRPSIQDLREAHQKLIRETKNLETAMQNKHADGAATALHMINDAVRQEANIATSIAEECDEDDIKTDIIEAIDDVQSIPPNLTQATKRALGKDALASSTAEVIQLDHDLIRASEALVAAATLGAKSDLSKICNDLDKHLEELRGNVDANNKSAAAVSAKSVACDAGNAVAVASAIADATQDLYQKARINELAGKMTNQTPVLFASTKNGLQDPKSQPVMKKFHGDVDEMKEINNQLLQSATLSPADLMQLRARELAEQLKALEDAVKRGDLQNTAQRLKKAREELAAQIALGHRLIAEATDPVRKKKLMDAVSALENVQSQLVAVSKAALTGDKAALAKLDMLLDEAKRAVGDIAKYSTPGAEESLRDAIRNVNQGVDKVNRALDRGDVSTARQAAVEVERGLKSETELLKKLEAEERDRREEGMKALLEKVRADLERLQPEYKKVVSIALIQTENPESRKKVEVVGNAIKAANTQVMKGLPTVEEKMGRMAQEIAQKLVELEKAGKAGDKQKGERLLADVENGLGRQIDLAEILVDQPNVDSLQRERARQHIKDLQQWATPALGKSTRAVLQAPQDVTKQNSLEESVDDVRGLSQALASTSTLGPHHLIVGAASELNSHLDNLEKQAENGRKPETLRVHRTIARDVPKQISFIDAVAAARGENTAHNKKIKDSADLLRKLVPELKTAAVALAENPTDSKKKEKLKDLVQQAKGANANLVAATTSPSDQIESATVAVSDALRRLARAVKSGDKAETERAVKAMKDAVTAQLSLARALAEQETDPERKRALLGAIRDLEEIADKIEPIARAALSGDRNAIAELDRLLAAAERANGRIGDLARIPVKGQIRNNAGLVKRDLEGLGTALRDHNKADSLNKVRELERDGMKHLELVNVQRKREKDPRRQKLLDESAKELGEVLKDLPDASRNVLANPGRQEHLKAAERLIQKGKDAADKSVVAVQPSDEDLTLLASYDLGKNIRCVPDGISARNQREVTSALEGARDAVARQKAAALRIGDRDPSKTNKITSAIADLDRLLRDFENAVGHATLNPQDRSKQDNLKSAGEQLNKASSIVVAAAVPELTSQLLDNSADIDKALEDLSNAVARGDRQGVVDTLGDARDAIRKQVAAGRALATLSGNKTLLAATEALENYGKELESDVNKLLAGDLEKDAAGVQKMNETMQKVREADAQIVGEGFPDGEQKALSGMKSILDATKNLMDALKAGDKTKSRLMADDLAKKMRRHIALCRAMAMKTTDPNKKKALWDAAMQLQNSLLNLLGPVLDMIASGDMKGAAELLQKIMNDFGKTHKGLQGAYAPKLEEIPTDEIAAAAYQVQKVVATKHIDETTPEGRLYAASNRIAEDMKLLADAARRGAKSDVILIARRIAQHVSEVFANAKIIADMCKDPILREQVMSVAHACKNITVQLKIITAVKAATDSNDPTVRAQLVKCAKSLASNVVGVCNAVDIASIRV